jgi:hypothetical protein
VVPARRQGRQLACSDRAGLTHLRDNPEADTLSDDVGHLRCGIVFFLGPGLPRRLLLRERSPDSSRNAPTVIPLRDREQPTKEANPARSARRRPEIRAEVYDSLSDDEAELIQIDENLIRANLSDTERILHVARRKELYEKLRRFPHAHPLAAQEQQARNTGQHYGGQQPSHYGPIPRHCHFSAVSNGRLKFKRLFKTGVSQKQGGFVDFIFFVRGTGTPDDGVLKDWRSGSAGHQLTGQASSKTPEATMI